MKSDAGVHLEEFTFVRLLGQDEDSSDNIQMTVDQPDLILYFVHKFFGTDWLHPLFRASNLSVLHSSRPK